MSKALERLPDGVDTNHVDVWFQDETRIGQQGSTTRLWTNTNPEKLYKNQDDNVLTCLQRDYLG